MIPQSKIQELLKKTMNEFFSADKASQILITDKSKAIEILTYLENAGYLEKIFDESWQHSLRGKILANKKTAKIFTTDTLKRQLNSLIKRVQIVNSSAEYPDYIQCVLVNSEYPITQKSNGIHIAYSMRSKGFTREEKRIAENELRQRHHGNFSNMVEKIFYPEEAVRLFLKAKSPVLKLKLYTIEEIRAMEGHIILEFPKEV